MAEKTKEQYEQFMKENPQLKEFINDIPKRFFSGHTMCDELGCQTILYINTFHVFVDDVTPYKAYMLCQHHAMQKLADKTIPKN